MTRRIVWEDRLPEITAQIRAEQTRIAEAWEALRAESQANYDEFAEAFGYSYEDVAAVAAWRAGKA